MQILIMTVAYLLNFIHDIQPHEHLTDYHNITAIFQYHESSHDEHDHHGHESPYEHTHHDENEDDELPGNIPLPHNHDIHSGEFYQTRHIQAPVQVDISNELELDYNLKPPELLQFQIILDNDDIYTSLFQASSLTMRAPPLFS